MAGYNGGNKLVVSEYLFKVLQLEDKRRAKKLKDELIHLETIPEHYELCSDDDPDAKKIVEDGSISDPLSEIELSTVQAKILDGDYHNYTKDEFVKLIPEQVDKEVNTYIKRAEGYTKTQIDDKISNIMAASGGGVTKINLKLTGFDKEGGLGGIPNNKVYPVGTDYDVILSDLFHKVNHPTYVAPKLTLVADKVLVERNVATDILLTPTFTKNDAGSVNSYVINRDATEIDNQVATSVVAYTDTHTFTDEVTYKYTVNYDDGVIKQNSDGLDDETGRILAGSIFATVKIKPVDPIYIGVVDNSVVVDETIMKTLDKTITDKTEVEQSVTANFQTVVFASVSPLTKIINPNGFDVLGNTTQSSITTTEGTTFNIYTLSNVNVSNFKYKLVF